MTSPKRFLLLCLILPLVSKIKSQKFFCSPYTYTQDSTLHTNVRLLLSYLSSNASQSDNGFYNTTVGGPEFKPNTTVYGFFQCLGDANVPTCQNCVSHVVDGFLQQCPNNNGAISWYENCWLHFSGDEHIFSILEEEPYVYLPSGYKVRDTDSFMNLLRENLRVVGKEASQGRSKKYSTREVNYSSSETLYTMAQCTPDISDNECFTCISNSIDNLPNCCNGSKGVTAGRPSCYLRYETYAFYEPLPSHPSPDSTSKGQSWLLLKKLNPCFMA